MFLVAHRVCNCRWPLNSTVSNYRIEAMSGFIWHQNCKACTSATSWNAIFKFSNYAQISLFWFCEWTELWTHMNKWNENRCISSLSKMASKILEPWKNVTRIGHGAFLALETRFQSISSLDLYREIKVRVGVIALGKQYF